MTIILLAVMALATTVVTVVCWGLMCGALERGRIVHAFWYLAAASAGAMVVAHLIRLTVS